jgi:hypothetical protein
MTPYRRQKISIRLENLSPEIVSDLKQYFPAKKIKAHKGKTEKNMDSFVVVLHLDKSFDCDKFERFITKNKIKKGKYMLWISLVTEQYSDGCLVPKHILRVLCRLGCDLNFSLTKV